MTETNTVWLPSLEQELTRHLLECSYDMHTFWVPPLEDFSWGFPFKAHTSTRLTDGEASKRIFKNGRHLWRSGAWVSTVHNDCVLRAQQSPADHMVHSKMFLALHLLSDCACFFQSAREAQLCSLRQNSAFQRTAGPSQRASRQATHSFPLSFVTEAWTGSLTLSHCRVHFITSCHLDI